MDQSAGPGEVKKEIRPLKNVQREVSVIGLGAMGSALARVLLRNGHRVTVWNRTSAKAEPLVRDGAVLAPRVASAVSASPIVLVCVEDYTVTRSLLGTEEVAPALAGRVLVELSTGTPQDARDAEAWARERGAGYLDGAIMATPSQIGRPDTPIFVSGAETVFRRSEPVLRTLAGNLMYMGESVGSASAWDLATLSCLHGARVFESEGLRVSDLGSMIADIAPILGEMIRHAGAVIQTGTYENPESSVKTCTVAFELSVKHAREARINAEFPTFALGLSKRATAAGYGEEEFAALIKVLREGDQPGARAAASQRG
jgi:3-hydroxyisobutyrate dehydrogenase-like beta-hydroxyacid dehydrogenase